MQTLRLYLCRLLGCITKTIEWTALAPGTETKFFTVTDSTLTFKTGVQVTKKKYDETGIVYLINNGGGGGATCRCPKGFRGSCPTSEPLPDPGGAVPAAITCVANECTHEEEPGLKATCGWYWGDPLGLNIIFSDILIP
jgi:hypothetical protein